MTWDVSEWWLNDQQGKDPRDPELRPLRYLQEEIMWANASQIHWIQRYKHHLVGSWQSPSPWIKKPIQCLWYSPTASQYSPTASWYRTPPQMPKYEHLDPDSSSFFNEYNTMLQRTVENQFCEHLIDEDQFCQWLMNIPNQVVTQVCQENEGGWVDWLTYQEGIGTRYNPIIVEDDWFRESLGVRGVMLHFFSFSTHVEHSLFISALLFTCFYLWLFHQHVFYFHFSFPS